MAGSHTILTTHLSKIDSSDLVFLKHEEWFEVDTLLENPKAKFVLSHYEGYPFDTWENDDYFILLEGMIYNFADEDIEKSCKTISDLFCGARNYLKKINEFVESADGDFIIQIYDKRNSKFILFNDYLGRLPIYYRISKELVLISRETKFILNFMPEIRFDRMRLVENLMFGYTLGKKTFFQDLHRLYPCKYILCEIKNDEIDYKVGNTAEFNFKTKNRFWNKKRSLVQLTNQFLIATENRVKKLREKGYHIISDLSGGYDSRSVIGAVSKFDKNVDYYTYEYIQDESKEASQLFKSLGSPGTYIKTSFQNIVDLENISELVFKTDGLVNYYTTGICYNDAKYIKKITPKKVGHFSGFEGDALRHPQKKWYISIFQGIEHSLYSALLFNEACSIINTNVIKSRNILANYLKSYTENKKCDILRHFYFEYQRNFDDSGGQERARLFRWIVKPLSIDFANTIYHQIPLKWTGYKYFIEFMRLIDPKLLEAAIYKSDIILKSKKSINKFEKKYQKQFGLKKRLRNILKFKFPSIVQIYKFFRAKEQGDNNKNNNKELLRLFYSYYDNLEKCNNLFDLESVEKYIHKAGGEYNRMTTLVMYLYEIEKRYRNKISIEE